MDLSILELFRIVLLQDAKMLTPSMVKESGVVPRRGHQGPSLASRGSPCCFCETVSTRQGQGESPHVDPLPFYVSRYHLNATRVVQR